MQSSKKKGIYNIDYSKNEEIQSWIKSHGISNKSAFMARFPDENFYEIKVKWRNIWNPVLKKRDWSQTDDILLLSSFVRNRANWTCMAKDLKNRSRVALKNRFMNSFKYKSFRPHENKFQELILHSTVKQLGKYLYTNILLILHFYLISSSRKRCVHEAKLLFQADRQLPAQNQGD